MPGSTPLDPVSQEKFRGNRPGPIGIASVGRERQGELRTAQSHLVVLSGDAYDHPRPPLPRDHQTLAGSTPTEPLGRPEIWRVR